MSSKRKSIPQFSNEDEEREFWAARDSAKYIDWSKAEKNPVCRVLSHLPGRLLSVYLNL